MTLTCHIYARSINQVLDFCLGLCCYRGIPYTTWEKKDKVIPEAEASWFVDQRASQLLEVQYSAKNSCKSHLVLNCNFFRNNSAKIESVLSSCLISSDSFFITGITLLCKRCICSALFVMHCVISCIS